MSSGEPARSVNEFLDSLGIEMPADEVLESGAGGRDRLADLKQLGMGHIKTDVPASSPKTLIVKERLRASGVDLTFSIHRDTDLEGLFSTWGELATALIAPSYTNSNLAIDEVAPFTRSLRRWLDERARPALKLIGPNVDNPDLASQVGDLSDVIDVGGFRSYIGPVEPSRVFGPWIDTTRLVAGDRPLVAVKAWHDGRDGGAPASEDVQAKYVIRLLLESLNHGVVRSFYNRLYDPPAGESGAGEGLLRFDGSEKPAFVSWSRLVRWLSPAHASPVVKTLPYTIEVEPSNADLVHHSLFLRGDGRFVLVLWMATAASTGPAQASIRLHFGVPMKSIMEGTPLGAEALVPRLNADSLSVEVSDRPLLLVLEPGC